MSLTRASSVLVHLQARALSPYLRALNYHDVPSQWAQRFDSQLAWLRPRFAPVGWSELVAFRERTLTRRWAGALLTFDDGLRSHFEVAAPILEAHGFRGWFFVPADFVDCPVAKQQEFARRARIRCEVPPDGRLAMTWDEIRDLRSRGHVIGCHTASHQRLGPELTPAQLAREIPQANARLEEALGAPVLSFAWVGGEEASYGAGAARAVREAGFKFSFMTNNAPVTSRTHPLHLQRTNVEAHLPLDVFRFQLTGLLDILYTPKRMRVNRLTRT
jgi:peptidoglycan/xylan/chitin deacetylase (PgdA/CDA1 family)